MKLILLFASSLREIFIWLESPTLLFGVSEPFDVIEDPVPKGDAPLDFVHVILFIRLDVAHFPEYFGEVRCWAVLSTIGRKSSLMNQTSLIQPF